MEWNQRRQTPRGMFDCAADRAVFDFTEVKSEATRTPSSEVSISTNTSRRRVSGKIEKNGKSAPYANN